MLPFLKKKQVAGLIVKNRHPNGNIDESDMDKDNSDASAPLEACARDMIAAYDAKDARQLAQALRNAFEVLESQESEPDHEEEQG